jgi:hypothetical protein
VDSGWIDLPLDLQPPLKTQTHSLTVVKSAFAGHARTKAIEVNKTNKTLLLLNRHLITPSSDQASRMDSPAPRIPIELQGEI